jgi:DnaK suppressor protein
VITTKGGGKVAPRTQQQLDDIRALLERRKEHLAQEIRSVRDQLARDRYLDLAGAVRDAGDDAVADVLTDVDHAMVARDIEEIRDIDAALERIVDGDFGTCIDCGAEIAHDRIAAYPTAKRCFPCQVQRERTYKRAQTPTL